MTPLDCLPAQAWAQVTGVFTDIDDTLTTDGAITPDALQALHDLRDAGLTVIAITGRPVGWSEPFALSWPLHAIVADTAQLVGVVEQARADNQQKFAQAREMFAQARQDMLAVGQQLRPDQPIKY